MTKAKNDWTWFDVPIDKLVSFNDFYLISEEYRCENPIGLVTRIAESGYSVMNLFSPLDTAFWCAVRPRIVMNINRQSEFIVQDKRAKREIKLTIEGHDILWDKPVSRLFDGLRDKFTRRLLVPGYSRDGIVHPGHSRMASLVVGNDKLEFFKTYLREEIQQLKDYAFLAIDEQIVLGASPNPMDHSVGGYLFGILSRSIDSADVWFEYKAERYLSQLKWIVARLENGMLFDVPMMPQEIIHPPLSFYLDVGSESDSVLNGVNNLVSRETLSYRARLVNLLRWPSFYDDVKSLLRSDKFTDCVIKTYGIREPYDLMDELNSYVEYIESKYPILTKTL